MQSMTVEILPIAQDDVDQALAYIAADNLPAANGLLADILEKLDQASRFPYSGTEDTSPAPFEWHARFPHPGRCMRK